MSYGVVAIVRNAADTIRPMLDSAIRAGATTATIVDTGSTDATKRKAKQADIELRWFERPWVNFGTNRTEAFRLAQGSADWLLALDADMTVKIDAGYEPPAADALMVEMGSPSFSYRLPLVLRGDLAWQSVGAVHEYTALATGELGARVPTDAITVSHPGANADAAKTRWHADLLEADLLVDPGNPRTVYYLARAYRDLGLTERARALFSKRSQMGSFEEERWHAQYQAALLIEPWTDRLDALLAAWESRPTRREPLWHAVAGLRARGQHHAADALASVDTGPCDDILFVERGAW
jgi:glycosyltransferase involved in cell wall biosynthesis